MAIRTLWATFLNLLFPTPCRTCGGPLNGKARSIICGSCWGKIRIIKGPHCGCCGRPLSSEKALSYSPGHLCGLCRSSEFYFIQARAAALYERGGVLREALLLFKHGGKRSLGKALVKLMIQEGAVKFDLANFDLLVPVPLHPKREREREFNQSLVLARGLGQHYKIPVLKGNLQRVRPTLPLSGGRKERVAQVRGAFSVKRSDRIKGKRVLLIDDVFTTGATVNECSRMLLRAGAVEVAVYTLARVP